MNRIEFQTIAKLRVREAKILLENKQYDGSYYLAGYAVECALKACITKQFQRHNMPDRKLVNDFYTHQLETLLKISGLGADHARELNSNQSFSLNWTIVKDWSEQFRYRFGISKQEAQDLYTAITSSKNGVLSWLKRRW